MLRVWKFLLFLIARLTLLSQQGTKKRLLSSKENLRDTRKESEPGRKCVTGEWTAENEIFLTRLISFIPYPCTYEKVNLSWKHCLLILPFCGFIYSSALHQYTDFIPGTIYLETWHHVLFIARKFRNFTTIMNTRGQYIFFPSLIAWGQYFFSLCFSRTFYLPPSCHSFSFFFSCFGHSRTISLFSFTFFPNAFTAKRCTSLCEANT